jgi:hypothetical protein
MKHKFDCRQDRDKSPDAKGQRQRCHQQLVGQLLEVDQVWRKPFFILNFDLDWDPPQCYGRAWRERKQRKYNRIISEGG